MNANELTLPSAYRGDIEIALSAETSKGDLDFVLMTEKAYSETIGGVYDQLFEKAIDMAERIQEQNERKYGLGRHPQRMVMLRAPYPLNPYKPLVSKAVAHMTTPESIVAFAGMTRFHILREFVESSLFGRELKHHWPERHQVDEDELMDIDSRGDIEDEITFWDHELLSTGATMNEAFDIIGEDRWARKTADFIANAEESPIRKAFRHITG